MPTLYHTKLAPTIFTSATAQAGYPASNMGNESLDRPWLATGVGAENPTLQLAAAGFIQGTFLHDINFNSCTVKRSADGVNFVDVGVANAYPDEHGRYRLKIDIAQAGVSVRYVPIGGTNDGLAFWRIGAGYLFGASVALPTGPNYDYRVRTRKPKVSQDLVNGRTAQADIGQRFDRIEFPYSRKYTQSLMTLRQKAEQGTVLLSLDIPDWPSQMWPVRCLDADADESFYRVHKARGLLTLTEMV